MMKHLRFLLIRLHKKIRSVKNIRGGMYIEEVVKPYAYVVSIISKNENILISLIELLKKKREL